jgi:uncharacterized protein DUF6644
MHTLLPFFKWCDGTAAGQAIRDSRFLFPIIESLHLFALTVLLGTVVVLNLRLLGAGLRTQPMPLVARSLAPLTFWSLLAMLATGSLLFCSEALKCYDSPPFQVKMVALFLAIVFHWTVFRPTVNSIAEPARPRRIATVMVSMMLWFGVATAGRAIGFY